MDHNVLILTAAFLGFIHTILGPDHYIPFVAIARARNWSMVRTVAITALCGAGHVLGSILLGLIGILVGVSVDKLQIIEQTRGSVAAWFLIGFGLLYTIYGLRKALRNKPHRHRHVHADGTEHEHMHIHKNDHSHVHDDKKRITPWVLFIIFVFGPCEVLIPILMYPAAQRNFGLLLVVVLVFAIATICTMVAAVMLALAGIKQVKFSKLERYSHAAAGILVTMCGVAVQFLGI